MSSKIINASSGILVSLVFLASIFYFSNSAHGFIEIFNEYQNNGASLEIGFVLKSAKYWWLLIFVPLIGIFYSFKDLAKKAWIHYGITLGLIPALYLLLLWASYVPIYDLKSAF